MVNFFAGVYLFVLSLEDIQKKKVSIWLVALATMSGSVYAIIARRGWGIFVDILPGVVLCLISIVLPGTLGVGDGLIGIAYGLVFGWLRTCLWLMFGFTVASVIGVLMCFRNGGRRAQMPFVPYLTIVHVGMCL